MVTTHHATRITALRSLAVITPLRSFVVIAVGVVVAVRLPASAATITGTVYADNNGDGRMSDGEHGVPDAVVAFDIETFVTTDRTGHFEIRIPDGQNGIVWVRIPDGYVPHPVWAAWPPDKPADRTAPDKTAPDKTAPDKTAPDKTAPDKTAPDKAAPVMLGLRPLARPAHQPLTFVVASDSHLSIAQTYNGAVDLAAAAQNATALDPPPAFFTILGDNTQGGKASEFDLVDSALAGIAVPWVPVPGNHDWYDVGVNWFKRYGPDNYSFDIANVHFVVWNLALDDATIKTFLTADLSYVNKSPAAQPMTIVALTHAPPSPYILGVLKQLGVAYVLTGHAHSNRAVDHAGVIELNSEPMLMGGLDFTPAGYRVVTIANGKLASYHRTTLDAPFVSVVAPARGQCVPPTGGELIVAAELDAGEPVVTARIDCATPIVLRRAGGWDWRAELPPLAPGAHAFTIDATTPSGAHGATTVAFDVCTPPSPVPIGSDWPQLGGNSAHDGATPHAIVPPLAARWVTAVGGHLLSASPAIAGGTIYATVTDLGDGVSGGVVALDLATGAVRWRTATPKQVRGSPAVIDATVVVPQIDGVVLGLDAATGELRWKHELASGVAPEAAALFASVAADGADALIGHQRAVAAIDAARGTRRWRFDPVPEGENSQSLAAIAISHAVGRPAIAVGTFNRLFGGVQAWDRATATPLWRREDDDTIAINATPVIGNDAVFVVDAADEVTALDLATGESRWHVALDPAGFEWGNATIGTPAFAHLDGARTDGGILVVPTLYRDVVALDAATGAELWRHAALPSPLRATHYRGANEAGYEASPVITGDIVWIADTSGELAAIDLRTGTPRWRTSIGAPVLSGLAASGDTLVVASYDGTIRALAPARDAPMLANNASPSCTSRVEPIGCCSTGRSPPLMLVLVVVAALRRRRA